MPILKTKNRKVLILTQYDLPANKHNMNAYQRMYYGSRYADITLLIRRNHDVSAEIRERISVYSAPFENRWLFLVYAVFFAIFLRFKGCRIIFTDPSGFAAVGLLVKTLAGYFWIMDIWDRPRWRTGRHEKGIRPPLSDRLVFRIMGYADFYLLSVLPQAAKDIRLKPERCLQLYNAIDLTEAADAPPHRPEDDPTLHLSYGRSEFWETMGLEVVIHAAEALKTMKCPAVIHLVGQLSEQSIAMIKASPAADYFKIHGFIPQSRMQFFRGIHVGLVPYLALEDLSYIFPIKVIEHLSQGNPVIASDVPGLTTMIKHEYNGPVSYTHLRAHET